MSNQKEKRLVLVTDFRHFFFFISVKYWGHCEIRARLRNKWFLEERFYFQNANFAQRILKTCFALRQVENF